MADPTLSNQAIRALHEVNLRLGQVVDWIEAAPHLMCDEEAATDVGLQIITGLRETRALGLKRMKELAAAAGVPSPAVIAALEASFDGAFDRTAETR
jgi:hypothetical protein